MADFEELAEVKLSPSRSVVVARRKNGDYWFNEKVATATYDGFTHKGFGVPESVSVDFLDHARSLLTGVDEDEQRLEISDDKQLVIWRPAPNVVDFRQWLISDGYTGFTKKGIRLMNSNAEKLIDKFEEMLQKPITVATGPSDRWALYDAHCKQCRTVSRPHYQDGYCEICYEHLHRRHETQAPLFGNNPIPEESDTDELVTIFRASKMLRMATESIRRLENTGELVPIRLEEAGVRMYRIADIAKYGQEHDRFAMPEQPPRKKKAPTVQRMVQASEYSYDQMKLNELLDDMDSLDPRIQERAGYAKLRRTAEMLSVDYRDIGYFLRLYAEYLPVREQFGQQYIKLADIQRFIETSPDLQDQTPESWNRMRLKCKKCKKTDNPHYADGICEQCVKSARHWEMKQLYESGFTLAQIGERYDVTRERARQLISRAVQLETDHKKLHFVHIDQSQVMDELKRENKRRKADKIDPMENELDATLVKSFDLYGRQCYLCHKPFNRKLINLSVHYGDGDSSNTEENNIYPICDDCKTRV